MNKVIIILLVICAVTFAQVGVTIDVAQQTPGVYVKIGNRFTLLKKQDFNSFYNDYHTFILQDATFKIPPVPSNSQLVVVGITNATLYNIVNNGNTIPYGISGSRLEKEGKIGIVGYSYSTEWFEKINKKDAYEYAGRNYYGILTAKANEKFSFGRFEGTKFKEINMTANKKFFTYNKQNNNANVSIERTMNGYFEIKFPTIPFGYYFIDGVGIVEFNNQAKKHYDKGMEYYNEKEYDKSIKEFSSAIKLSANNTNFIEAYIYRANAYNENGEFNRAITDYDKVISLNPNNTDAYVKRGTIYKNNGNLDRAIADFGQVMRLNPNEAKAYIERGGLYLNKGDYDNAIADYDQAIMLNNKDTLAYYNLGVAYKNKGDEIRAIFTDNSDGKKYKIVKIGEQIWMGENLKYSTENSKCYDNKEENCNIYGYLYDWEEAQNVCPGGWHLPSKSEWDILVNAAGTANAAGRNLKAKSGWNGNDKGLDSYGFSALPGGWGEKSFGRDVFNSINESGVYWSYSQHGVSNAFRYVIESSKPDIDINYRDKKRFLSIRCIKNDPYLEEYTTDKDEPEVVADSTGLQNPDVEDESEAAESSSTGGCEAETAKAKIIYNRCIKIGKGAGGYKKCAADYKYQKAIAKQVCQTKQKQEGEHQ